MFYEKSLLLLSVYIWKQKTQPLVIY